MAGEEANGANSNQPLLLMALLILSSIFLLQTYLRSKRKPAARFPPGPTALPIIGHLHLLDQIPHQALHKLAQRYGPLMSLRLGSVHCVVASTAEAARECLKSQDTVFCDRPGSVAVHHLTYGSADFSFAPYGSHWRAMKRLIVSDLLGARTLELHRPVRRQEVARLVRTIQEKAVKGEPVDVGGELVKLANNVICRMAMGRTWVGSADEARKIVEETAELTGRFNLADFLWFCRGMDLQGFGKRLSDLHRRFDAMMEGILKHREEERREKGEKSDGVKDLLDILLAAYEDGKAELNLSRENIKALILDIFAAGTDTSAITTEWALAELVNHPSVLRKVQAELDGVAGASRLVDESDVADLPYLQAIVKETLRLHPTGPLILRESAEPCIVMNHDVPARTRLFVNVWAVGRDPQQWRDPMEFRPERFLPGEEAAGVEPRGQHFQLLPFGSGRRGCPGTSLALHVVHAALGALVQCFEWEVPGGAGGVGMEEGVGLTLPRKKPLVLIPKTRLDPFVSLDDLLAN